MQSISEILAQELNCKQEYIENVIALLDEGNTIPFIARYRKEQHGAMDDTALRTLETRLQYLRNLAQRREEVKSSIAAQEKLTDELAKAIDEAATLAEVEDLYRPYKPKRRTRATIAKEKGLEPLADAIFAQTLQTDAPGAAATAEVLPEIVDAVGDRVKIIVDGGIRNGTDIFRALALGADAVMICRPFLISYYGGKTDGIVTYIEKLRVELKDAMYMCGARKISDIDRSMIRF